MNVECRRESFDPESFSSKLTTEGLVAGCGSLVLKSIKRSVINIDGFVKSQNFYFCSL